MSDVWQPEITRFLRNFEPTKNSGIQRDTTSLPRSNPGFPWKYEVGITRQWSGIYNTWKIAAARVNQIKYCETWRDVNYQRSCSKDRYSRRTQSQRKHSLMQCILMFCIVLQSYVYLYTQFQNPPYLVNCWILLKFTGKTIKNFHLQWDSNPPNVLLLGKIRNLVSRSRTPKRATLL